jgi:hypothetical protein
MEIIKEKKKKTAPSNLATDMKYEERPIIFYFTRLRFEFNPKINRTCLKDKDEDISISDLMTQYFLGLPNFKMQILHVQ